ncbi:MAG: hypothetical protein RLZZ101_230 [Pseudomonadota bacterium]|jgi:YjbE family integral membrane protein|nr:hypothetical protein [Burkholderiaceae bacterium]
MELFSAEFFSALLAIIVIDLVLAGDNAIVIAMAARNLPTHLQKKAVVWGAVGAIVVRSAMTLVVVWLLKIPGLLLVGGALLVWIAYGLLKPKDEDENHGEGSSSFWGAMKTIIIADAVMGVDNVLAVAGASHGSYLLVVLGLLISIPIVIWGSTFILRLLERYQSIIYIGAAVLAFTAAKMMMSEPLIKDLPVFENSLFSYLIYLLVVGGVLVAGFIRNQMHLESKIQERAALDKETLSMSTLQTTSNHGGSSMKRILLPVDGSKNSEFAVRHVVNQFIQNSAMEIHLINIQPKLPRHIGRFLSKQNVQEWNQEKSKLALANARTILESHAIPHSVISKTGDRAKIIADEARRLRCDQIVLGTARKNSITRMLENSTTNKLIEITNIPIEVVSGETVSPLEQWGIPTAGAGIIATLLGVILD